MVAAKMRTRYVHISAVLRLIRLREGATEPRCLNQQEVSLCSARCPATGEAVVRDGSLMIACHLQQVSACRVEPVMSAEVPIGVQRQ
jgi:hypothetical protein